MHILIHLCFVLIVLIVIVDCQGARGGGGFRGGSSSYRAGSRISSGSRCTGSNCNTGVIVGSIVGGIFGLIAVVFGTMYCYYRCKGKSLQSNTTFIASAPSDKDQTYSKAYFQTGIWSSRYQQHNRWHGPHQLALTFNTSMSRVDGEGTDDIGAFSIDGIYSFQTNRLALTKVYKPGTGNTTENYGHKVTIQLNWNATLNQFEGKWYIQTSRYRGEDRFELKFHQAIGLIDEKAKY
ncbi:hypothetical protein I4U23_015350 [Adineta vaga]|nr:hypothetical protein I4U23_015350 [Adineta vaga]